MLSLTIRKTRKMAWIRILCTHHSPALAPVTWKAMLKANTFILPFLLGRVEGYLPNLSYLVKAKVCPSFLEHHIFVPYLNMFLIPNYRISLKFYALTTYRNHYCHKKSKVETKFTIVIFFYFLFRSAESEESLSDLDTSRRNSVEEEQVSKR